LGRNIGSSCDYRIDHIFNKQTFGKKVNSVMEEAKNAITNFTNEV